MEPHAPTIAIAPGRQVMSPAIEEYRPRNLVGAFYLILSLAITSVGVVLSWSTSWIVWILGQWLLAIALLQWFAILHEAQHKTLFRTRWLNKWTGHLAGFFALIPADCWRLVHAKHHLWTGWQDLDMTTATLVPRRLRIVERLTINLCWRLWIPLFATLYRLNNYWNLPRLWRQFARPNERRLLVMNVVGYLVGYLVVLRLGGIDTLARYGGLALFVSFAFQDLLILSQHTHLPMQLSRGRAVDPFPPAAQDVFTRSLEFPAWFSRFVLLNVDAHALHHMYPRIPGYDLHRLDQQTRHATPWWRWIIQAKSVPGDVLLFQNRDQTGYLF